VSILWKRKGWDGSQLFGRQLSSRHLEGPEAALLNLERASRFWRCWVPGHVGVRDCRFSLDPTRLARDKEASWAISPGRDGMSQRLNLVLSMSITPFLVVRVARVRREGVSSC